jgi:hypothetical protein
MTKTIRLTLLISCLAFALTPRARADEPLASWNDGLAKRAIVNGPYLCLIVHQDARREWAYDHPSTIGQLDKGLTVAHQRGWTVVDMKNDWKRIFGFKSEPEPEHASGAARPALRSRATAR